MWLARTAIGVVLFFNLECAMAFLWAPQDFTPGFELQGAAGSAAMRGMGILFLMWNVPYLFAAWQPNRHRLSLYEALIMQTIGVIGESLLLWSLNGGHLALTLSMTRFIAFDAGGLLLLCLAAWITHETR
jgi:hypothetical protein